MKFQCIAGAADGHHVPAPADGVPLPFILVPIPVEGPVNYFAAYRLHNGSIEAASGKRDHRWTYEPLRALDVFPCLAQPKADQRDMDL